jgi:protein O-GlcNAc transferase
MSVSVGEAINVAIECFRTGEFTTVRGVCDEILRSEPANAVALHLRGLANANCGDTAQAVADLRHALMIRPNDKEVRNNLGNIYKGMGELKAARECYEQVLEQEPENEPVLFNLANVLVDLGELQAAKELYEKVIAIAPQFVEAYYKLGLAYQSEGKLKEAVAEFKKCIARDTNHVEAQIEVGNCELIAGRRDEALNAYKVAVMVSPSSKDKVQGAVHLAEGDLERAAEFFSNAISGDQNDAFAYRCLGKALTEAGNYDDAIMVYRTAIRLQPKATHVHLELGVAYAKAGYAKQAVEYFEYVAQAWPHAYAPILGRGIALLPDLDAFDEAEAKLDLSTPAKIDEAVCALYMLQPDNLRRAVGSHRELMQRFGNIASRIMAAKYPQWAQPLSMPEPDAGGRIRVGVVSRKWHDRKNWRTVSSGIVENLDDARFHIFEYPTSGVSFEQLCARIRSDNLHVLVYPDLDERALQMAALRLAPVQCTTWARTETTGLPTIDYFLSGDLFEPKNAEANYSEKLIRLPHLFMYHKPNLKDVVEAKPGQVYADPIGLDDPASAMRAIEMNMPVVTIRGDFGKGRRTAALLEQIGITDTIASNKEEYDALLERLSSDEDFWKSISLRIAERKQWVFKDHETIAAFQDWATNVASGATT